MIITPSSASRFLRLRGWPLPHSRLLPLYVARADDMIISAGYNIAGPEVEDALLRHPDVAEAAVVGRPDEARGQVVVAYAVLKAGARQDAEALRAFLKGELAPYKCPREIVFLYALPRTATGKVQRFRLRTSDEPHTRDKPHTGDDQR